MGYKVAVVGATGNVGREMLDIVAERGFPVDEMVAVASRRSQGTEVSFGDRTLKVKALEGYDFSDVDICLMSAGGSVSKEWSPRIAQQGAVVIDNSSAWRYDSDVPLIVPEVNADAVAGFRKRGIIANPNCSTIQMVVALKPLYDKAGIERINVATYQSVSGTGKEAIEELEEQTRAIFTQKDVVTEVYPKQIAFNVLPHIDVFQDNGYTKEEMKMVWETQKIMEDDSIRVNPTTARVPVFYGHSEAVHIETKQKLSAAEARALLEKAPGVTVIDERKPGGYPTPALEAAGKDPVYVGRIREDISHPRGLDMWVVSDNIRKGAALNSIQIAEILIEKYLN
jgi:aspartate-semialdehyde dehydrogenase